VGVGLLSNARWSPTPSVVETAWSLVVLNAFDVRGHPAVGEYPGLERVAAYGLREDYVRHLETIRAAVSLP